LLEYLTKIVYVSNVLPYNQVGKARREIMSNINERIKELRNQLHLSQDYVAKYLGVSRSTYTQMENGKRRMLADEVALLSNLFGVSTDSLLNNPELSQPATVFARSFEKLDQRDQEEIMNLIRFKEQIKAQRKQ
jgi:transcriptional regulator with XRE-family HTH domain